MPPAWAFPCSGSLLGAAAPEVVLLQVPGRLGEAELVRPVVHPVVHREQVRGRRVDVVALRRGERGRVAALLEPLVRPRERVVARRRLGVVGALLGRVVGVPLLGGVRVVAPVRERRRAPAGRPRPTRRRGRVAAGSHAAGRAGLPAPQLLVSVERVVRSAARWGTRPRSGCRRGGRRGPRARAPRRAAVDERREAQRLGRRVVDQHHLDAGRLPSARVGTATLRTRTAR